MTFSSEQMVAMIIGTSFAAGLNVYATVGCLGLLSHFGVIQLPAALHGLESWWIIVPAAALFALEFFADKIPAFDLVWNALHTFVRVPVAAYLSYAASSQFSPRMQLVTTLLGATIAFAAHGGKTAVRAAVTPSPEPFSNVALSLGEDVSVANGYRARCPLDRPLAAPTVSRGISRAVAGLAFLCLCPVFESLGGVPRFDRGCSWLKGRRRCSSASAS